MEINYLREFVVLARTNNFLEAAEILFCSQSALSKHIKRMEDELGVLLFDRTTRTVSLSKHGQLLLPYAEQIVALQAKYTEVLQDSLDAEQETLTLGSIPALAQYNITDVLVRFKKTRSQSIINVLQAGSDDLEEMLRQKKCDLAFIRYVDDVDGVDDLDDDLARIPFAIDSLVAVLPITHPLASQSLIDLHLLADENFLFIKEDTMPYRLSLSACHQCGFEPKIAYTDHRLENLVDLVIKGMGLALMMKRLALHISSSEIAILDVSPSMSTQISLCYLKETDLSNAAQHFVFCAESQRETL